MNSNFRNKPGMQDVIRKFNHQPFLLCAVFILTLLISACEKTVYFDVDTRENKLVVNSLIQPDSAIVARVTLSTDPLAINFDNVEVEDATISLFKNGLFTGNFDYTTNGNYSFDPAILNAQPGDDLKIEVTAPGRESVSATTVIPASIPIEDVKITDTIFEEVSYSVFDSLGNFYTIDTVVPHYELKLTFTDPPGDNFYSLRVNYEDFYSETNACFTTDDPVFTIDGSYGFDPDEDDKVTLCGEVFFSDATFDNTQKTITFSVLEIPTEFITDPKFIFVLSHLSEAYYSYHASSILQGNGNDDPFSEPVTVFSNIQNGFGIFAGLSVSIMDIDL